MDIGPEEFEFAGAPAEGRAPLLQIADYLVNGAGFPRRLASERWPPIGGPPHRVHGL